MLTSNQEEQHVCITDHSNYISSDYFGIAFGFILRPDATDIGTQKQETVRSSE